MNIEKRVKTLDVLVYVAIAAIVAGIGLTYYMYSQGQFGQ